MVRLPLKQSRLIFFLVKVSSMGSWRECVGLAVALRIVPVSECRSFGLSNLGVSRVGLCSEVSVEGSGIQENLVFITNLHPIFEET